MKKISLFSLLALIFSTPTLAQSSTLGETTDQALQGVYSLKNGIDQITQELFALDDAERAKNPRLDARYREAREEIVRVINSINLTTENITSSIQKLATYQAQMQSSIEELQSLRLSSSHAKEYLADYLNLVYKMHLDTYGDASTPSLVRLLSNAKNIPQTLV